MRLLFLNHNVVWHGGFFRAYHWGRHLARRGHSVTLLSISELNRLRFEVQERDGIRLVKTPDLLAGRLRSGWDVWDTINRIVYLWPGGFDLVHSVDSRPACILPALALQKLKGTTLVLDWLDWWGHGGTIVERPGGLGDRLFGPIETLWEESFRRCADGTVVISSSLRERAISLGVAPNSIVRIPYGADVEGIQPGARGAARSALGIDPGVPVLGYVGLMFERDASLLLHSFALIRAQDPRVKLFLIGNTNIRVSAPLLEEGAVVLTGRVSYERLQQYIAACDAMLLPFKDSVANRGRWPSKVCDYLAAGKPVVATRVGDVEALMQKGCCGVLAADAPADFASATLAALGSRDGLARMGQNARKIAETDLDWRILTDQLEQFYLQVLGK